MNIFKKLQQSRIVQKLLPEFRSSIYGRVVFIIISLSLLFFVSFSMIFRSVNEKYMQNVIKQRGTNVALLVQSALYKAMLENDAAGMQSTLNVINKMTGVEDVTVYNQMDEPAYTSYASDDESHGNPNCKECHSDIASLFSNEHEAFRIIDIDSDCDMSTGYDTKRQLFVRSTILNEPSCYNAACHAHPREQKLLGSLIIKLPLCNLDRAQDEISRDFFLTATAMTIGLLIILVYFTRKRIKEPLNSLMSVSKAVKTGDRSRRVKISHNQLHDMKMLSMTFNQMLDNLESATTELENWSQQLEYKVRKKTEELGQVQYELINVERTASLGKLSLSVAHEINNPLSGILIYTKLVRKQIEKSDIEPEKKKTMVKHLLMTENESKRCGNIVKGLLDFSRKDQDAFKIKHLHDILSETYDLMAHSMKIGKIMFLTDFSAEKDTVYCNPNQLKQACITVLVNASEAINENGEIIIKTHNPDAEHITLTIEDNGSGIPEEVIPHIFEPFFTTKQNEKGIGLGLAITHGIIENHNGKINLDSELNKGTSVIITLPLKNETKQEDHDR